MLSGQEKNGCKQKTGNFLLSGIVRSFQSTVQDADEATKMKT